MPVRLLLAGVLMSSMAIAPPLVVGAQPGALPAPGFHHLHLNSINPGAAIAFYVKQFPSTSAITFAGQPALQSPNNVLILFTKVNAPPATQPSTAFWHFGWAKVTFLEKPYTLGGLRAVMIEGPSREAIELVEVK